MEAVHHLCQSQQHTATMTSHINTTLTLIAKLSRKTSAPETNVNHVKRTVFGVKDCTPILPVDHPIDTAMALKTMEGVRSVL
jgi:hypothetical protein